VTYRRTKVAAAALLVAAALGLAGVMIAALVAGAL
jgi:hypothetical protein